MPARPLQRFLTDYPGLTGFIGRIILSYYDNTTSMEQTVKRNREVSAADGELNTENKRTRKSTP